MSKTSFEELSFAERKALADRVKPARQEKGLKQEELADLIGATRQTISNIERGQVPQAQTLARIYEVLGIELAPYEHKPKTDVWLGIIGAMLDSTPDDLVDEAGRAATAAITNTWTSTRMSVDTDNLNQSDYTLAARNRSTDRGESHYD